jgi:GTPase SAR1 family protein
MEQFRQFDIDKRTTMGALGKLREILGELGGMGIDVQDDVQKIASALASIESDVLRVALVGAFSDGKTSVVAAWLGKVMDDMNIDMDESSDRLAIYKPVGLPGQCEIVDTPGLFGDREAAINGEQVMYENVTKRYISEAHLILYVLDATNPLKESHGAVVNWLLRDLNKLSSTVFVINKMDEVTDLTEHRLFAEQAAIKTENLKSKLQRVANLTQEELAQLNIVCIASNPNGRGLEFWFGKPEQYEDRSRINDLKAMTSRILQATVPEVLIAKTGLDVVRDVVGQKLNLAQAQLNELESYEQQNREESTRIQQDITQGRAEVKRLAGELFNELQALENLLLGRLRPLALEDIRGFLEDEIGYAEVGVGYKLHLKIKTAIDRFFVQSSAVRSRIALDISRQLNSSESFLNTMSDGALKSVGGALSKISKLNPVVIMGTITWARDVLSQLTGTAISFKPWETFKLAGNISKWAGPVGAAVALGSDVYAAYKAHELEQELRQVKDAITSAIKGAFKDIYDLISDDDKMFDFFAPQLKDFEKIVRVMSESADSIRTNRGKLMQVQRQLNSLALPISGIGAVRADEPDRSALAQRR